ncbi:MAG: precorrin-3B synthase [Rhizobiaceae bacterium]
MSSQFRRGACPGLSDPMPTGDGLLARLYLDHPDIQPANLIHILQSATQHGSGFVEVTSRGNLQIRGLTEHSARLLEQDVQTTGLEYGGLPITVNPLAGIDADEIADPLPVIRSVRQALSSDLRNRLAPKVSIVVDGGGQLPLDRVSSDIRLTAVESGADPVWLVAIGGHAVNARPVGRVRSSAAADTVINLLERIAAKGHDARGRDLEQIDLLSLADQPLSGNGIENRQMASPVGRFRQTGGLCAIGVALEFGVCKADLLIRLLERIEEIGAGSVRLVAGRAIVVLSLSGSKADRLRQAADDLGFIVGADDPRLSVSACAGAPFCASAHFATRKLARQLVDAAGPLLDGSFVLHVSGCAKRCADPSGPQVAIVGVPGSCEMRRELGDGKQSGFQLRENQLPAIFFAASEQFVRSSKPFKCAKEFLDAMPVNQLSAQPVE